MNYQEACKRAEEVLRNAKIEDAANDAWLLLEYVTGMSRARYYVDGSCPMKDEEEVRYEALVAQRAKRIPLQHLTGVQEFMGLEFLVNADVLVPRQDTEILVETAEQMIRGMQKECAVLDMCTGSGCIAISLQVRNPKIRCTAVDVSGKALAVAKENAKKHQADIAFVQSDLFSAVNGTYDLIVSNPPYIPTRVIEELEAEVKLHDPFSALDGKEDGLYFYRILAEESKQYLKEGGRLCLEIGHDQREAVETLLREQGFEAIRTKKDLAGLDRVVSAVYNKG